MREDEVDGLVRAQVPHEHRAVVARAHDEVFLPVLLHAQHVLSLNPRYVLVAHQRSHRLPLLGVENGYRLARRGHDGVALEPAVVHDGELRVDQELGPGVGALEVEDGDGAFLEADADVSVAEGRETGDAPVEELGPGEVVFDGSGINCRGHSIINRSIKNPNGIFTLCQPKKVAAQKKTGTAKNATGKKKVIQKSGLFENTPRRFGIGGAVQPKRDLTRFVRWPRYILLQRQKRILMRRLKVPPALNQFTKTADANQGTRR